MGFWHRLGNALSSAPAVSWYVKIERLNGAQKFAVPDKETGKRVIESLLAGADYRQGDGFIRAADIVGAQLYWHSFDE